MNLDHSADPARNRNASFALRFAFHLKRRWIQCVVLGVVGFVVRMPALQGQLVWDDEYLAHLNPFIKSPLLIFEAFRHYLFLDSFSAHYRPVQNLSFIFDYYFWNADTYGFHFTSLLLHVASGLFLFCLLARLLPTLAHTRKSKERECSPCDTSLVAFLLALLWIVHPVHSAAVDYISGRADSLAFMFACAGWLLVLEARETRRMFARVFLYCAAASSALLALCSREIACIWLLLFLLHLFCFEKERPLKPKLFTLACCLALVVAYAGLRQLPEDRSGPGPSSSWSNPVRAAFMLRALGDYGRLMVYPSNLHMERTVVDGENYRSNRSWRNSVRSEYLSMLGLVVLSVAIYGASRKETGQSLRIFGAAWFVLAYLPTSNIVELNATVAEHWLYLPSVGFLLFVAGCALALPKRFEKPLAIFASVAVLALGVRSYIRSTDWATPETFYERTVAAGGTSTRVSVNLAQLYARRGEYARAEAIYRNVLKMMPDYPIARNSLAEVLFRQGKKEEAEALFVSSNQDAVVSRKEYPRTWIAALNLAHLRFRVQDIEGTLAVLDKAHAEYPNSWEIISFEAEVLRQARGPDAALHLVEDFARTNWWHYSASLALGRLYAEKGDVARAEAALRHASWLDVHDVEALNLIARMDLRQNRLEAALRSQRRALARQPDQSSQYLLLSEILQKMGRNAEADASTAQVSRLQALAQAQLAAN